MNTNLLMIQIQYFIERSVFTDDFGVNVFEIGLKNAIKSKNYKYAKKMLQGEVGVPPNIKKSTMCKLREIQNNGRNRTIYF